MSKPSPPAAMTWTTWEELLLTCAVKRHGQDWDSVAMELQNRNSQPLVLNAQICMNKYKDLKRRFMDERDDDERRGGGAPIADDGDDSIPWLEELRKLRVAELKQEVHRSDLSIQSLQLKVKQLEEERERNSVENENDDEKPDLESDKKNERSDNDKSDGDGAPAEVPTGNDTGKSVSGEHSDRDSRTLNESNSEGNQEKSGGAEPEPAETGAVKRDPEAKQDSCNDSSDTVARHAASKPSQEKKTEDESNELRNSAAESKERTKESSDVQSSASLTKKIRRRVEVAGGSNGKDGGTLATIKRESAKTEPLAEFLDIFTSHKHGSMFERRLDIQKTDNYKNTVRQHVDLETIQTRIGDGSYSCPAKFYSDLLLLFNNAVVFFPKDSNQSAAAVELRNLVLKEIKKKRIGRQLNPSPEPAPKPDPEKPDSLLAKHKSSASIVVCRKRSSISAKPISSKQPDNKPDSKTVKPASKPDPKPDSKPVKSANKPDPKPDSKPVKSSSNEEESSMKLKGKEKPVTGVRSMRRSSNSNSNRTSNTTSNRGNSSTVASGKMEAAPAKGEKKKAEVAPAKKSGAADFLKRIKRNSPAKGRPEPLPAKGSGEEGSSRRDQQKKKVEEKKEVAPAKKKGGGGAVGGGSAKQAKEESSPSKRAVGRPPKKGAEVIPSKRGREVDGGGSGGGGEDDKGGSNSKRPKKRSRR